ncbi:hypothetical protein LZ30DRAFT_468022 [Colletotrichum cereale]|nr:hypothetical protein LZ30DRAFT_468022 [Colletotrichum cereale]
MTGFSIITSFRMIAYTTFARPPSPEHSTIGKVSAHTTRNRCIAPLPHPEGLRSSHAIGRPGRDPLVRARILLGGGPPGQSSGTRLWCPTLRGVLRRALWRSCRGLACRYRLYPALPWEAPTGGEVRGAGVVRRASRGSDLRQHPAGWQCRRASSTPASP